MQALSLCKKVCPDKIPVITEEFIGDGADGDVYGIQNHPDRVIKFSVLYEWNYQKIDAIYSRIDKVLTFLELNKPPAYARVYAHGLMHNETRMIELDGSPSSQKYILYYYILEKLQPISECEQKVFHSIISHQDNNISRNYTVSQIKKILVCMSYGLDFDMSEVIIFHMNITECIVNHNDVHQRNIMKNKLGQFRLIDFDRSTIGDL